MAEIFFRPRAIKGFKIIPSTERTRIKLAIEELKRGVLPVHTKKLEGHVAGYRIRIGKWRVLFVLSKNEIDIVDIFMKKSGNDYKRRM